MKHRLICWTRAALFELAIVQIAVGIALWALPYTLGNTEPPSVLAMSALALVFSGVCTMAVCAIDEAKGQTG